MPPRANRHSPSPASSPPTGAGLTKRQRQQLRIHRPALPSPPVVGSPVVASPLREADTAGFAEDAAPDVEEDRSGVGVEVEELEEDREAIRMIRPPPLPHYEEERERASPSKYPTPLPDEEDEDDYPQEALRIVEGLWAEEEVPTGTLIDMGDPVDELVGEGEEEGEQAMEETYVAPVPVPPPTTRTTTKPMAPTPPTTAPAPRPTTTAARVSARAPPPAAPASAPTPMPPIPTTSTTTAAQRRRRSSPPPASSSSALSQHGHGHGQQQGHEQGQGQAHLRAPEAPRHPPPRALSALSHTLRALAASTQAVTSYAYNSPSSHSSTQSHHVNAARHHEDGGEEDGEEEIKGARWDEVGVGGAGSSTTRRLLTLTYAAGVQVWDASALGGVSEVLNLRIPTPASFSSSNTTTSDTSNTTTTTTTSRARSSVDTLRAVHHHNSDNDKKEEKEGDGDDEEMYGPILGASILPAARGSKEESGGLELGILTPHALYIYALAAGHVVARCAFPPAASKDKGTGKDAARQEYAYGGGGGRVREREPEIGTPCAFEAAERVIVVTTHSPPALVVLSRPGLRVLHVIPASALAVPHAPISPVGTNSSGSRRSSYAGSPPFSSSSTSASPPTTFTSPPTHAPSPSPPPPTPTSALHGRLLAFLAPAPPAAPPLGAPANTSADAEGGVTATWGRSIGRFFSRSAPAATAIAASVFAAAGSPPLPGVGMVGGIGGGEKGTAWVRVVDLGALGNGGKGGGLREVHVFEAGRAAVGGLAFARDGTRLCVVRRDGLGAGVWALRPSPYPQLPGDPPKQVYALRRGRTGAVVEGVAGARDGRFVALATRRRTVHVFAVNPYGGRADHRSHLGGRVRDAEGAGAEVQQGDGPGEPTEVHALVRMRLPAAKTHQHHQHGEEELPPPPPPAPLAIAFVPASSTSVGTGTGLRSPVSSPSSPSSSAIQDVLVFDPADGVLSLRRVTLALEAPHAAGLPISVSLPAARIAGLSMSASPPGYAYPGAPAAGSYARTVYGQGTGQQQAEVPGMELGGREAVVATWSLRRRRGWAEIRRTEAGAGAGEVVLASGRPVKEDWIAQAELSTFSSAPRVLPRAIYLSHQFSFHALGEDYHALIRRYQLAIGGAKIEVRREVEVSAFSAAGTGGEAFVEGHNASSSPRDIRRRSRAASSFDEPLASALAGVAHYRDVRPPPVLPMLPNGSPSSFRSAMPVPVRAVVAGLGDGVAEGLARVRREMRHQRQRQLARSPPAKGGDDVEASVPLEFDEEDEDFTGPPASSADEVFLRVHADREDDDALSATSRNGGDSVASISTPATSAHPLEDEERMEVDLNADLDAGEGEGEWHGWAAEDKLAVEEAERFDDISVVGFLDEEQAAMQAEAARRKSVAAGAGTAGGRGRKKRRN